MSVDSFLPGDYSDTVISRKSLQTQGIISKKLETLEFVSVNNELKAQDCKVYGFTYNLSIVLLHCFFAL